MNARRAHRGRPGPSASSRPRNRPDVAAARVRPRTPRRALIAFAAAWWLTAPAAQAQSDIGAAEVSGMLVSLIAVIGVILAVAYVLRRTPLGAAARQSGPLKVLATLPLGPKERLLLVEADGTQLLLAVSPAGVFNVGRPGGAGGPADGSDASRRMRERAEHLIGGRG